MKLFVTVGSLFPFDRLISTLDEWCENCTHQVVAQVGKTNLMPRNMEYHDLLHAGDYNRIFNDSDIIISHAGMGVILKSLVNNKPLLVLPRKVSYNEVTTDHQLATARFYDRMGYLNVAWDEQQLIEYLEDLTAIKPRKKISEYASEHLIAGLRNFIDTSG